MHLASNHEPSKIALPAHAAEPICFGVCAGFFMPAQDAAPPSGTAVLIVSPWGFEDVCLRKFHRQLADELAARGVPSLRFDFPGAGNSLDAPRDISELETWLNAITQATQALKTRSGCEKIILAGHGLGATLAAKALPRLPDGVTGLALLAPVYSGRLWARETGLWWKIIATDLGISGTQPEDGSLTIAGLTLAPETTKDIKATKLTADMIPADKSVIFACRPGRENDTVFAEEMRAAGCNVASIAFKGHEALIANPLVQKIPNDVITEIADKIRKAAPVEKPQKTPSVPAAAALTTGGFTETGLRFGKNNRLTGILCEPVGPRTGATVIIHSTSYERSTGWARSTVEAARKLAAEGIATFRFDSTNVADSAPLPEASPRVLYTDLQVADLKSAVSTLEERNMGPFVLSGRCSGSYASFQLALTDSRVAGLVLVNNIIFVRDPTKELVEDVTKVARPLEEYSARARDPETLKRILRGEVDIPAAARNMLRSVAKRVASKITPFLGSLAAENRHNARIAAAFNMLAQRDLPLTLIYADNDVGLEQLQLTFGNQVVDNPPAANVRFRLVSDADHNMTPAHANAAVVEEISRLAHSLAVPRK
ncbi:alpha/beta fold hydrolase [Rhizobium sp. L1K21]|uniref:alpha/beta fold hydrolase n=1 Tax=Rhizobium sp. L1K21 TaxID=2954933 RepID=UPI002092C6F5|nr:alpha/beta fold hydrolase [Rhizobium sp. L1K21]MCO6185300.1 lysophospholipase [Rhizobium sp. L1K21]